MKRTRTAQFSAIAAAAAATGLVFPGVAGAVPGPNTLPEVVTAVGASTTYEVTGAIFAAANSSPANTDPDTYVNVPPVLVPGQVFPVPGDVFDPGTAYSSTNPPPNGAIAGSSALAGSTTAGSGSIEVVRSDSPRALSDPSTFEFYGFARDAVSWAASSAGAGTGVTLTLDQLRGIYSGAITNWNQVGGTDAPIAVYLPQIGSGTLSFFMNTVLGFDPTTKPVTIKRFQENDATTIPAADRPGAIALYSVAQWVSQGNGVVSDKRAGFFEGTLTSAGSDTAPVSGSAPNYAPAYSDGFLGSSFVYHVIDTRSPSHDAALNVVGFDPNGPSPLCNGSYASVLAQYGFKPLPANSAGVTCVRS
ncbi:substrate-binding domain-containing protein [Amycolatopsis sp. NPDC000746]|uniref:substrate-binding domain-containing protein n=1 Tax=Amycolatopsis sp. NPDC000746 TaxID=3154270 RepID=UPI003329EB56